MIRTAIVTVSMGMLALSGCGGREATAEPRTTASAPATATAPSPSQPAVLLKMLGKDELKGALLTVQDMPDGFSQDPPSDPRSGRTFCGYKVPHEAKIEVSNGFTKGGGVSAEISAVGIRQFASESNAKESFDALVDEMQTCTGETREGEKVTYTVTKAPALGSGAIGYRIETESFTILQTFVLVGPSLVNAAIGGIVNADFDAGNSLVKAQVDKYSTAAG